MRGSGRAYRQMTERDSGIGRTMAAFIDRVKTCTEVARGGRASVLIVLTVLLLSCGDGDTLQFSTCGSGGEVPPSTNPLNLSRTTCASASPAFSESGNVLYLVWQETQVGNGDILFSRSIDGGNTFSPAVNLSDNNAASATPAIASDGGNVYVVWEELESGASTEVFFTRSTDGGISFGPAARISDAAAAGTAATDTHSARSPAVAVSGNTVWVAWEENIFNIANPDDVIAVQSEILGSASTDAGGSFTPLPQGISRSSGCPSGGTQPGMFSHFPSLTVSGSDLFAVWQEDTQLSCTVPPPNDPAKADVFFGKSTAGSPTVFSAAKPVANAGLRNANASFPSVAEGAGILQIVWSEAPVGSTNTEVFYSRSTNGGSTFSTPVNLSDSAETSGAPNLAASGNNLIVVWEEANPTLRGIVSRTSVDAGLNFSTPPVNVSQTTGSSGFAKVILLPPDVHLIWVDASVGNPEIVYRRFNF